MYRAIKFNYCLLSIRPRCLFRFLFAFSPFESGWPNYERYLRTQQPPTANGHRATANGQQTKGNLFSHNFLNRPHLRHRNVVQKPFSRQIITSWPGPTLLTAQGDKSPWVWIPSHTEIVRNASSESVKYRINSFELVLGFLPCF